MKLDLAWLDAFVARQAGQAGQSPESYGASNRLDLVQASARRAASQPISAETEARLEVWVDHQCRYRDVFARLRSIDPGAVALKGFSIGDRYPDGWVRTANDLDVVLSTAADLWRCVGALVPEWELTTFTLVPDEGRCHPLVGLDIPPSSTEIPVCRAELSVALSAGDMWRSATVIAGPPEIRAESTAVQVLALAQEGLERPFHARDCLDLAVLCPDLTHSELARLWKLLDASASWLEFKALVATAARLDVPGIAESGLPAIARRRAAAARPKLRRVNRWLRFMSNPANRAAWLLGRLTIERTPGRFAERVAAAVQRAYPPKAMLKAGLPLFGVPLDGQRTSDADAEVTLRETRAGGLVAETPVGSFAMIYGGTVREDVIADIVDAIR